MSAAVSLDELRDRRDQLESRLEEGWKRIGEAETAGKDVDRWLVVFKQLLDEYMSICDLMLAAA